MSIFFSSGDTYLIVIDYQAFGTRKTEMVMSDEILISYIYKRRIQNACDSAIIYSITRYLLEKVVIEEFKYKNIEGERKGQPKLQVKNIRTIKKIQRDE